MFLHIVFHAVIVTFDGIAVNASVETAFISAHIDTFNAVADVALILILFSKNRITGNSFNQFFVDT